DLAMDLVLERPEDREYPLDLGASSVLLRRKLLGDCGTSTDLTFYCEECGGTFVTAMRLHMHKRASHRKKWLVCKCLDCSHSPNNRSHHAGHEQIHYVVKQELGCHLRSHTVERPFQCNHCNQRFTRISSVGKHERTKHAS
ncbi:hypothetical protein MTO96_038117, partial [Rhipicephalus appendiculatus]